MILVWLLLWAIAGTPRLHEWNGWLVSLIVVIWLTVVVRPKGSK